MADMTLSDLQKNAAIQFDDERVNALLDASYEIDKIARVLPGLVPMDDDQTHYAVRAMAGRLLRLTSVLMAGLSEKDAPNSKLKAILSLEGSQG